MLLANAFALQTRSILNMLHGWLSSRNNHDIHRAFQALRMLVAHSELPQHAAMWMYTSKVRPETAESRCDCDRLGRMPCSSVRCLPRPHMSHMLVLWLLAYIPALQGDFTDRLPYLQVAMGCMDSLHAIMAQRHPPLKQQESQELAISNVSCG